MVDRYGLHELLGAQAAPALEQFLAMRRAETEVLGKTVQRWLLGPRLGQESDGTADVIIVARTVRATGVDIGTIFSLCMGTSLSCF